MLSLLLLGNVFGAGGEITAIAPSSSGKPGATAPVVQPPLSASTAALPATAIDWAHMDHAKEAVNVATSLNPQQLETLTEKHPWMIQMMTKAAGAAQAKTDSTAKLQKINNTLASAQQERDLLKQERDLITKRLQVLSVEHDKLVKIALDLEQQLQQMNPPSQALAAAKAQEAGAQQAYDSVMKRYSDLYSPGGTENDAQKLQALQSIDWSSTTLSRALQAVLVGGDPDDVKYVLPKDLDEDVRENIANARIALSVAKAEVDKNSPKPPAQSTFQSALAIVGAVQSL